MKEGARTAYLGSWEYQNAKPQDKLQLEGAIYKAKPMLKHLYSRLVTVL